MADRFPPCTMTKGSTFRGLASETLYLFPSGLKRSGKETFWRQSSKTRGLHVKMSPKVHLCRAQIYLHQCERRAPPPTCAFHMHPGVQRSVDFAAAASARPPPLPTASRDPGNGGGKRRKWEKETAAASNECGGESKRKKKSNFCHLHRNLVRNKLNESSFSSVFLSFCLFFNGNTTRTIKPPGTASPTISVSPLEVIMQRQASVTHQE